jgi:hypothetical protein
MELINSTSWGQGYKGETCKGDTAITPAQITSDMVMNKQHVTWFMERNGYDGLIPRLNNKCTPVTINNKEYVRLSDVENISWPTFMFAMREYVDVELRVVPL